MFSFSVIISSQLRLWHSQIYASAAQPSPALFLPSTLTTKPFPSLPFLFLLAFPIWDPEMIIPQRGFIYLFILLPPYFLPCFGLGCRFLNEAKLVFLPASLLPSL